MASAMSYVIEMSAALIAVAFIVPLAMSYLFNGSSWGETPAVVVTLGTTVLAIFAVLGLMLKFMPEELKQRVGLWSNPNGDISLQSIAQFIAVYIVVRLSIHKLNQTKITSLNHYEQ